MRFNCNKPKPKKYLKYEEMTFKNKNVVVFSYFPSAYKLFFNFKIRKRLINF
uniref:Uncharacterized protein n=1 Tax=Meloidogyne enterolobii TaxID=390850 RepID=A0A6V7VX60_MELEN|nr:unnamed protein product [Meloidogyne enterolobii]